MLNQMTNINEKQTSKANVIKDLNAVDELQQSDMASVLGGSKTSEEVDSGIEIGAEVAHHDTYK